MQTRLMSVAVAIALMAGMSIIRSILVLMGTLLFFMKTSELIGIREKTASYYTLFLPLCINKLRKNTKYSAIIISFNENLGFKIIGD